MVRAAQPVAIESGLPTVAFTSSSVRGVRRTVALANNAAAAWNGTLRIAAPGCVARPRCTELGQRAQATDVCNKFDSDRGGSHLCSRMGKYRRGGGQRCANMRGDSIEKKKTA